MMENTLFTLRLWFHRLRKRYQKTPARKALPVVPGLPDGIEMQTLEDICSRRLNCSIASVSHIHLSGWKLSGAYRLIIETMGGDKRLLVFKNAHYGSVEIPALKGLPVNPGPPEYEIYRQAGGRLANFLPEVYLAEEIIPGRTYRYLLEDLRVDYRLMKSEEDKAHVGGLLPELHRALNEWGVSANTSPLITYGQNFSAELQEYTRRNLEQYHRLNSSSALNLVLSQWHNISQVHLQPEFFSAPPQLIHGDSNFSNIHLHRSDPARFKLVDWEWAGFGCPYADLTAMLKGSLFDLQRKAFTRFYQACIECSDDSRSLYGDEKQQFRQFLWSNLERSILDAGFVVSQHMNATNQARINLETAIARSLHFIFYFYRQLS